MKPTSSFTRLLIGAGLLASTMTLSGMAIAAGAEAQAQPDATIEMRKWKVGFILGGGAGSGELQHKGKAYPLTIDGIRVGATVGVTVADLQGNVYNLSKPEDIEGAYVAAEAAAALVKGAKVWTLKNQNGVVLKLEGKQQGIDISLDVGGMNIALKR